MAELKALGVMKHVSTPCLLLVTVIASSVLASICPEKQYLNAELQVCTNCSNCTHGTVVLKPCEMHKDTICGPISALSELFTGNSGNPHRHHNDRHRHHEKHRKEDKKRYEDELRSRAVASVALEVSSSEAPFSSTETLVWDWQAIALTSAVFAVILFFLVVTMYSLHQARQWRRLKENFEADVEELSARLSLMAATSTEKCELLDGHHGFGGTTPPVDSSYLSSRCVYLEQLLSVRQEDEKNRISKPRGNVYIEENKPKK
ncbi:tumor necrosis factor receptor superfamily member wengen [Sitophilus oryzae]|uniref:Tumor necrosis factor receptor superfamily member wengen n=1 Tax=Sitophilus oryzae TaxID=7048 RepID=A0A6J2YUI0_SITOR|nr:tumor necrosis factor receptor superfamily member wengen [Sitophilus oryzae]